MSEIRDRLMQALDAADRAALPGFPTGPMSERWLDAFLPALEAQGLKIIDAQDDPDRVRRGVQDVIDAVDGSLVVDGERLARVLRPLGVREC